MSRHVMKTSSSGQRGHTCWFDIVVKVVSNSAYFAQDIDDKAERALGMLYTKHLKM